MPTEHELTINDANDMTDELDLFIEEESGDPHFVAALADAQARSRLLDDLVSCRRSMKLSQATVAERMGTTQSSVSEFETGSSDFYVSTAQRYARAITAKVRLVVEMPCDGPWAEATSTRQYVRRDAQLTAVRTGVPAAEVAWPLSAASAARVGA